MPSSLFDCGVKKENLYDWKRETIQSSGRSGFISWKRKRFALLLSQDGEFVLLVGVHLLDPDVFFLSFVPDVCIYVIWIDVNTICLVLYVFRICYRLQEEIYNTTE